MIGFMLGIYAPSHVVQWSHRESVSQRICLTANAWQWECLTLSTLIKEYPTLRSSSQTMCLTENIPQWECPRLNMSNREFPKLRMYWQRMCLEKNAQQRMRATRTTWVWYLCTIAKPPTGCRSAVYSSDVLGLSAGCRGSSAAVHVAGSCSKTLVSAVAPALSHASDAVGAAARETRSCFCCIFCWGVLTDASAANSRCSIAAPWLPRAAPAIDTCLLPLPLQCAHSHYAHARQGHHSTNIHAHPHVPHISQSPCDCSYTHINTCVCTGVNVHACMPVDIGMQFFFHTCMHEYVCM